MDRILGEREKMMRNTGNGPGTETLKEFPMETVFDVTHGFGKGSRGKCRAFAVRGLNCEHMQRLCWEWQKDRKEDWVPVFFKHLTMFLSSLGRGQTIGGIKDLDERSASSVVPRLFQLALAPAPVSLEQVEPAESARAPIMSTPNALDASDSSTSVARPAG